MFDDLGVDRSGTLTAMWLRFHNRQSTADYDLVLSERKARGTWSPIPHMVTEGHTLEGDIYHADLAVNASGAAIVAWDRWDLGGVYVSYRPRAGASWTPAEPAEPSGMYLSDVGIDDAGRVMLLYSTKNQGDVVVIGNPITGWGRPQPLPETSGIVDSQFAVSAAGAVVVVGARGPRDRRSYTMRMSPSGRWRAPVRQPGRGYVKTIAIDRAGRALYVWWDESRLMTRSSGTGGRWQEPCVLADGVPDPREIDDVDSHVAVNRRGDAIVVWRTKDEAPHLWARFKPAGQAWAETVEVTAGATESLGDFRAALGLRGDAAVAWIAQDRRQLNILRMSPAR